MNNCILLAIKLPYKNDNDLNEELIEMSLLAKTLNYTIASTYIQKRKKIDSATFFGKGKLNDISEKISMLKINTLFINEELSPTHFRNIQKFFGTNIIVVDRTKLILDIFETHAKTKEAKAQVRLAKMEYLLPRLVGQWTHLERQLGGTGIRGGPGEKQIEIDRRLARNEISKLKKELTKITKQRSTQIKSRKGMFKIVLTGYTNSGKSTLLKQLTGYNAFTKDQLFATLDTTTKQLILPNKNKVLVSDTVGFLRKLPHSLIASFRSTLSEINNADLILNIVDINASDIDGHIDTINETLKTLDCDKKDSVLVFNKIDNVKDDIIFKKINKKYNNPLLISALENIRINALLKEIEKKSTFNYKEYIIKIPYSKSAIIKELYNKSIIISRKDTYSHIEFKIKSNEDFYQKIMALI